jgi:putative pyruvate formate lyase activating enzyme
MAGYVDVYLTDMKYFSPELSEKYSRAKGYYEVASKSLKAMVLQQPKCEFDENGIIKKGVIVRHLVLPSHRKDSINILDRVAEICGVDNIKLSLMSQYTPEFCKGEYPELKRRVTTFEYNSVVEYAMKLGFDGYIQERSSASSVYTPDFKKGEDI